MNAILRVNDFLFHEKIKLKNFHSYKQKKFTLVYETKK